MSETEELQHREHVRGGCVLVGAIALLVFYVLSPPFVAFCMNHIVPDSLVMATIKTLQIVYFPLQWGYDNLDWVKSFYDWYRQLFDFP
jgi:hypothetical protein